MALIKQSQAAQPVVLVNTAGQADDGPAGTAGYLPVGGTVVVSGIVAANGTSSQTTIPAPGAGKTAYITGVHVTSVGAATTNGFVTTTISGLAGSTMTFDCPSPTTLGVGNLLLSFATPLPASTQNAAITIAVAANAATTAGNTRLTVTGFNA